MDSRPVPVDRDAGDGGGEPAGGRPAERDSADRPAGAGLSVSSEPSDPSHARRDASLAAMYSRFDAVAERFGRVYGLRLPRHMAVSAAFFDSLDSGERRALRDLLGLSPGGISAYFGPGGAALTCRDGLDERLESRFRRDPPEFVTVLYGGTDGLHFGLWYDDPAELPTCIAYNYARDSAETWTAGYLTVLGQIHQRIDDFVEQADDDHGARIAADPTNGGGEGRHPLDRLRRAVDVFARADREAVEQDGVSRWFGAPRPRIVGPLGPALPEGSGDPRGGRQADQRYRAYHSRSSEVRQWIDEAERELRAGAPAFALVLGQELHWLDSPDYEPDARRLLAGAYRALGRGALADITTVHYAHRDLASVSILGI